MGLYTVLKPCLKGENINITKNDLNFFFSPKILISFKKLKIFSGEISLNNMRSDLAVKWPSLISIKSEQVSTLVSFVASDVLTTICHLAIVNVCMIIILYIGNIQISILLLCFLYLFVELMFMMNE